MELIYAALLLHRSGQKIDETNLKKVLDAANAKVDDTRVKALVAALDGVDIEKIIKESAQVTAAGPKVVEDKKEEKKKEEPKEEKKEEAAAAGLASLFG